MNKMECFDAFMARRIRRALGNMVLERHIDVQTAQGMRAALIAYMRDECTSTYDWLELCEIMAWKRRKAYSPEEGAA